MLAKQLLSFNRSVMSDSLQPHGLQHTRLPCPLPSPEVCSNSCSLSWWCHPTILSSIIRFLSCFLSFLASGSFPTSWLFSSGQSLSFSIRPSSEYSGLTFFRIDWFDLLAVQGTLKSLSPTPQFKKASFFSLLYCPTLTVMHDYRKNHSFDYSVLCQQSDVSDF